jgi:cation diffusion facilitator family transporter
MPAVREVGEWAAESRLKQRSAALSVLSNSGLILLKVMAGTITGSVSLLTEAVHSSIDLVASVVAFFSVRKADEPADESHRYGHEKIENLAAAIEGILILIGSAAIAFEAVRHLVDHGTIQAVGLGIAVAAISLVVNLGVSFRLARAARRTDSPALAGDAAHLGTDALTSATVLIGLVLVDVTGAQWIDPVVALGVALVIVRTGVRLLLQSSRVLVDESLPPAEVDRHVGGPRGGWLSRAAHTPGRVAPLCRPPRPVPRGNLAGGRAPDCSRAPGHDRRAAAGGRCADPSRTAGSGAAGGGAPHPGAEGLMQVEEDHGQRMRNRWVAESTI